MGGEGRHFGSVEELERYKAEHFPEFFKLKTCAGCRWWGVEMDHEAFWPCERSRTEMDELVVSNPSSPKFIARDYEGYHAWLSTASDFGCNQWEGK